MKRKAFYTLGSCIPPGNFRQFLFFLTFTALLFAGEIRGQGGTCGQITFNFVEYEPCKYRLTYNNATDCYTDIILSLDQGDFASYSANSAAGFSVEVFGPAQLRITHANGFLPLGNQAPLIFTLPPGLVTTAPIAYNDQCGMVGCAVFPPPVLESCPDPGDASIIGTVYRECNPKPYSNQPTIAGWTVQLLDSDGNILAETQTASDGSYAFYDLHAGQYVVRSVSPPDWTPTFPASGQVSVVLPASAQIIGNFGVCNFNCCTSITTSLQQVSSMNDTCCYLLSYQTPPPACIESFTVSASSNLLISNWFIQLPGWTVFPVNAHTINIFPPASSGGFVPGGNLAPVKFCVSGGIFHNLTVSSNFHDSAGQYHCDSKRSFTCNSSGNACVCPNGGIPGNNLVTNGNFSASGSFTSGYAAHAGLLVLMEGEYWLGNDPNLINGGFVHCQDHTTGTGNMMVVNGATSPNVKVWCQTIPVTPNTIYNLGAWVTSVSNASPANLQWLINGVAAGNSFTAPMACNWSEYCESWFSDTSTTATICLVDLNTASSGNDFALDDISFVKCTPASTCTCKQNPTVHYISDTGISYPLICNGPSTTFPCPNGNVKITGDFGCVDANGNPCVPASPIDWTLYGPSGIVAQSAIIGGAPWTLNFTLADVGASGPYTLYMTTLCAGQMDSCKCVLKWYQECLPACHCDSSSWDLSFRYGGGLNVPVQCGQTLNVTTGSALYTSFHCLGANCPNPRVDWVLTGPNGYNHFMNGVTPTQPFVIPELQPTNFPYPGTYKLTMLGICDKDTCMCMLSFCLPPPPPEIHDTSICRTLSSAYIPLYGCPPTQCGVSQVQYFVKKCNDPNFQPYQISPGPGCDPLLILPYQYPGVPCLEVYAVVTMSGNCCVSQLTTPVATINLCDPISCSITNNNPPYCKMGQPSALVGNVSGANCNYTQEWYDDNNQLVSTSLTYTPPVLTFSGAGLPCYKDFTYTLKIIGVCGASTCSTSIRVYNDLSNNGDLIVNPTEPMPLCPGEDVILEYTDHCSGPPSKWTWYYSTDPINNGYTPVPGAGMTNTILYSNRLWQTTWFMVESVNGVCPAQQKPLKVEVKDPLTIVNFTAIPDPCIENYVQLTVDFTPSPNPGGGAPGCDYTIEWYKDGNLIHSSSSLTSSVSYTYFQTGSVAGVYYAIVKDNCCDQAVQTWPEILNPSCDPVILGPCYICGAGPVVLDGEMVLPPKDPCPYGSCTYQWFKLDISTGVWNPIGSGNSVTISMGGHYKWVSTCDYGFGPCVKEAYHDVAQCNISGTGCFLVSAPDVQVTPDMQVDIKPNPTSGDVTVSINPAPLQHGRLEVVDLSGRILMSSDLPMGATSHNLALGKLSAGLYFIRVYENETLLWVGKIVRAD